ncbi:MAG: four helix bundle protein [Kofleriaceae bacterium]
MPNFQELRVYKNAIKLLALVDELVEQIPRGHAQRCDQLERAAESVIRNIAEGSGRWSPADSAKHYKIARGEVMECAGSLDVLLVRRLIDAQRHGELTLLVDIIIKQLSKMIVQLQV